MQNNNNLEYRVGYTPLSGLLYAGQVRRDTGKWEGQPHEVTAWALLAVARKISHEGNDLLCPLPDGRVMRLSADFFDPEGMADEGK
ncbi:hypothetical protein PO654_11210 [Phytobacter diazotrophicus]|uniref:DUF7446 family protein n=1 Tax=Phytobacter diazotrophicus TaxID=395631 RepID=UPI00290D3580|nr:hypothetical protein [Enterobacteriaceae bacterium]MDU4355647.1 hypothetical protein [Phytobacter diazotrophicus]